LAGADSDREDAPSPIDAARLPLSPVHNDSEPQSWPFIALAAAERPIKLLNDERKASVAAAAASRRTIRARRVYLPATRLQPIRPVKDPGMLSVEPTGGTKLPPPAARHSPAIDAGVL